MNYFGLFNFFFFFGDDPQKSKLCMRFRELLSCLIMYEILCFGLFNYV
jgi:hypothetical protein